MTGDSKMRKTCEVVQVETTHNDSNKIQVGGDKEKDETCDNSDNIPVFGDFNDGKICKDFLNLFDDSIKTAKEDTVLTRAEKLRAQIDYYFSDANLNTDKYLRTMLEKSARNAIPVTSLLKFCAINQLVNNDKSLLKKHIRKLKFVNAECLPGFQLIGRRLDKPFVFDKHYMRNNTNRIIYIGELPPIATIDTVIKWASRFDHCSVYPVHRAKDSTIQSAFIAFDSQHVVDVILDLHKNGRIKYIQSGSEYNVVIMPHLTYVNIKRNQRTTKRRRNKNNRIKTFYKQFLGQLLV